MGRRYRSLVIALAALAATLTGCTGDGADGPTGAPAPGRPSPPPVPRSLAGGAELPALPAWLEEAAEAPVVGAEPLTGPPPGCEAHLARADAGRDAVFVTGHRTPLGVSATFRASLQDGGPGELSGEPVALSCDGVSRSGGLVWSSAVAPWGDDAALRRAGGGLTVHDTGGQRVASLWVLPPPDAAWLVHDEGAYRTAYPLGEGPVRILTVPRPDTRDGLEIRLTVFGPDGGSREEVVVEGRVAG